MVFPRMNLRPTDKPSGEKPRDLEKGGDVPADSEKGWWQRLQAKRTGVFAFLVVVGVAAGLVFFILFFAACHVLPDFISKHCQNDGAGTAAVGKRLVRLAKKAIVEVLADRYRLHDRSPINIIPAVAISAPGSTSNPATIAIATGSTTILPTGLRMGTKLVARGAGVIFRPDR